MLKRAIAGVVFVVVIQGNRISNLCDESEEIGIIPSGLIELPAL